jgi:hypothetical protein
MLKKIVQSTILSDGSLTFIPVATFKNKNVLSISTLDTTTHKLWVKSNSRLLMKKTKKK